MTGTAIQPVWILAALGAWLGLWALNAALAHRSGRHPALGRIVPLVFGLAVLALWEGLVRGLGLPEVILPPPSMVAATVAENPALLWSDFAQTILRGAVPGFLIGAAAAFAVAIAIDRSPFLTRGLLPVGNFVAALPIVGIAPIMVTWFGFGWQSKAAVVCAMVFFPILVNTVTGLAAAERMQRDLMRTWSASYRQTLIHLRLPAAMPFIFNGLKVSTTLALIGAIVAEFFGSPTRGMGFRISTAVGSLELPMVWAQIVVAALAGTVFFGLVTAIERRVTFWHPSHRKR